MSKYKSGDKFILEIESDHGDGWYGIKGVEHLIEPEAMLDKLDRFFYIPHPFEEESKIEVYRGWQVLMEEPDDMTPDEKKRLKRIKAIPSVAFNAARDREELIREQINQLENESDQLFDFLNGEVST